MSTYIVGIRLHNWRCFKGEQVVEDLQPVPYSLLAREVGNSERSNWLGKSSFLEAVRWCLTAKLRKEESVDSWITRGEKEGGVDLEFSDGVFISRNRGAKSTLHVELPEYLGGNTLIADQAQAWIESNLIPADLLDYTAFFEQGKTDQIITMNPSARSDMVAGWLGMEPLEEAEAVSVNHIRSLEQLIASNERKLSERTVEAMQRSITNLDAARVNARTDMDVDKERLEELEEARAWHAEWLQAVANAAEHRRLKREIESDPITPVKESLEKSNELVARETRDKSQLAICKKSVSEAKLLAAGQFDGQCPVASGFACPATVSINSQRTQNASRLEEAKKRLNDASTKADASKQKSADHRRALGKLQSQHRQRAVQQKRLDELAGTFEVASLKEPPNPDVTEAEAKLAAWPQELANLKAERDLLQKELAAHNEATEVLVGLKASVAVERAAAVVLGRQGAQRVLTENNLNLIAQRANGAMARSGIPLTLQVSWGKEGKKLDTACPSCGYFFGASQKAKSCPECDAERPRKVDGKLTIELANVSGGSRNIAGLMLQLSAARWLREKRNIGLASYFIDEPFGQLDRANRTSIACKLHSMLETEFGARQAFIVAHDRDTLETLPARIEIVSDGGFSTVSVNHGS